MSDALSMEGCIRLCEAVLGWRNSPYNENLCSCEKHRELVALWDKTQETPPQRGWHS